MSPFSLIDSQIAPLLDSTTVELEDIIDIEIYQPTQYYSFMTNVITDDSESLLEIFPLFPPDLINRQNVKPMNIISNLEITKDFEFDHIFINDMIKKFALTPSLCNHCNDLSRHFLDPESYIHQLYLKNARWVLNKNSILSMQLEPYKSLKLPIFDISNITVQHPPNRPCGKIHLVCDSSNIEKNIHLQCCSYVFYFHFV